MWSPLVAVIIPTFNREVFIREAIQSVLTQTYKNYEIIVVDDGSKDRTREIVQSMGQNIKYIYKNNSGPSSTRNMGIKHSRGEVIAFLDSDDLWEPNKLEKQVAEFQKDPSVVLVSSNYRFIDQNNQIVKDPGADFGYIPDSFFVKDLLAIRFPFGATTAFMIKRSVFNDIGFFNEDLRISEDLDLLIRIGLRFKIAYIDEVLISVRLHDNHLMRETPRFQVWVNSVQVLKRYYSDIINKVPNVRKYYSRFYSIAANSALLSGNRRKAIELYLQGISNTPISLEGYKDLVRCFLPLGYLKFRYNSRIKSKIPALLRKYN